MQGGDPTTQSEYELHVAVVRLLDAILVGAMYFHPPNGGWRSKVESARLKNMGVVAGIPDLVILYDGKTLFIELKKQKTGRVSPAQLVCHAQLAACGHHVEVCRSLDEVIAALDRHGVPHRRILPLGV